jgi:hypothetical protein
MQVRVLLYLQGHFPLQINLQIILLVLVVFAGNLVILSELVKILRIRNLLILML